MPALQSAMRKRITFTVTNDLSMDQRVHRIATTLVQDGWDAKAVGRLLPSSRPLEKRPYETFRLTMRVTKGKWFYLWFNIRLFFHLLTHAPDVVYANDLDTLPAAWLAARLRGRKLVYDSHEWWTEIPELTVRPRTRAVWLWLEKRLFRRADVILTVNPTLADTYKDIYHVPVAYLRNFPARAKTIRERTSPGRLIWYQGALNEGRGVELMIAALNHLPGDYRLGIAGSGPLKEKLEDLARSSGLEGRVDFHGLLPFEQLPSLTNQAAIGLSLEESYSKSYQVATPNKLYDYIQAGVPVLVSGLQEMRNILEEHKVGGILEEEERNPESLAASIREIVENEEKWFAYRANCLVAAQSLCWENESSRLKEILEPVR